MNFDSKIDSVHIKLTDGLWPKLGCKIFIFAKYKSSDGIWFEHDISTTKIKKR